MAGRSLVAQIESWSPSRIRRVAAVTGLVQTAFVAWVISTSGYFRDDYPFFVVARQGGFSGSELTRNVFGSLIPGFQLGNSLLASLQPIPRWPAIVIPVLLYGLALLLTFRLGALLFGTRPLLIALMALAGFSGVLATSLVWWTAGLNSLPVVVCDLLALDGLARHAATGRRRHLVTSVVAFGVGIAFYDASCSFLVVLVLFSALYLTGPGSWRSMVHGFARSWWVWVGYGVPIVLNVTWRQLHPSSYALPPLPSIGLALRFVGAGWAEGFVPSSLGLSFSSLPQAPGVLVVVAGQLFFVGVVALSIRRRRRAIRAWCLFASSFLAIELVAAIGRGYAGTLFALNTVYWAVQPFLLMLAVGLAFWPLCFGPQATEEPPARRHGPAAHPPWRQWVTMLGVAGACTIGVLGALSFWSTPDRSQGAQNRSYLATLRHAWDVAQASSTHPFVWDTQVPPFVLTPIFAPFNRVATTVGLLVPLRMDATQGQGYLVDTSGDLLPTSVTVVSRAALAGRTGCLSARPAARTVSVPVHPLVHPGNWFLRLRYGRSSGFWAAARGQRVRLARGSGAFVIPYSTTSATSSISLTIPPGASACLAQVVLELPVAREG
jgi:hypothetical protein